MRYLLILALSLAASALSAGWVDDWVDNMAETPSGTFEGQKRNYWTGGGFQARWRTSSDYPLSVSLPRVKSGCGGIDMFLGGFTFMDPEYLVDKFQRSIQAAPAVAFDMALKEMCVECSESMKALESITSKLNSIQMDECSMSKKMVAIASGDEVQGDLLGEITSALAMDNASAKNSYENTTATQASGGKSQEDIRQALDHCPADFKAIYSGGSIIGNTAQKIGMSGYADLIRGYLGDVEVTYNSGNKLFTADPVPKCKGNDEFSPADFLDGLTEARHSVANGGACYSDSATRLEDFVATRLQSIADKIQTSTALTVEETNFIKTSGMPILSIMKGAVLEQDVTGTISVIARPIASAYAYRLMNDLYINMEFLVSKTKEARRGGVSTTGGSANKCDVNVLLSAFTYTDEIIDNARGLRQSTWDAWAYSMQELNWVLTATREMQRRSEAARSAQIQTINN